MRHINVLWPPKLETEWQKLFEECTSITPDSIMEDESAFARIVEDYMLHIRFPFQPKHVQKIVCV